MNNDFSDSVKKLLSSTKFEVPKITTFDPGPSIFESKIDEIDPDSFAPNRTAKSAEHMAEKLDAMMEAYLKDSEEQRHRDRANRRIAIATLLASLVAAAAAVYQIFG